MKYEIEVPDGFRLKGLHHFGKTDKGADQWWAYVETGSPEYGKYHHFQGALGFSIDEAVANAHRALVKSIEARKASVPPSLAGLKIKLDLSHLGRPVKPTFEGPDEEA